ncbi:hypothetical protein HMPREF1862_00812 [Varibaculum cambriense]|uniref:Uncharacterized protein n=1 Tax=Varibaculum cambriense TaxID=184870 RepID=A0AB34WZZ9_9ACTO|nr:hypothetical protein HMPREF1862_00812 [Varibaculum cambriense]
MLADSFQPAAQFLGKTTYFDAEARLNGELQGAPVAVVGSDVAPEPLGKEPGEFHPLGAAVEPVMVAGD